jgi:hypothetical protein
MNFPSLAFDVADIAIRIAVGLIVLDPWREDRAG